MEKEAVTEMIFMWKWGSQSLCAAAQLGVFDHLEYILERAAECLKGTYPSRAGRRAASWGSKVEDAFGRVM